MVKHFCYLLLCTITITSCSRTVKLKQEWFQLQSQKIVFPQYNPHIPTNKVLHTFLLDENNKVIDLEEKPEHPKSNKAAFATYMYTKETVPMIKKYLETGNMPDAPGYFLQWLHKKKPVYAYVMNGECYDVGTLKALEEVRSIYGN